MTSILAFVVAAVLEIAGCFAFWMWLRRGASPVLAAVGIVSLCGFALALTRVDSAFAGRAYAAMVGSTLPRRCAGCGSLNARDRRPLICLGPASPLVGR